MKILVTGANGFVGKNLIAELKNRGYRNIVKYTRETESAKLDKYTKDCEFVFHLAGVNRPESNTEFMEGNVAMTYKLLNSLEKNNNKAPILFTSSIQAEKENPYGRSKKAGEDLIFSHGKESGTKVYVYRLTNLFGKWGKPNYNSVVATFCHNIARDLEIEISNPEYELSLVYIDSVVDEFLKALEGNPTRDGQFCIVPSPTKIKLGRLAELIQAFKESRETLNIPNMKDPLIKELYSTYLSYLPENKFSYPLKMNIDDRGSFTEFIRTAERGQISVNISKAGIIKGNHWHHTKNEKFMVVSGEGIIRFRKIDSEKVIEYKVSGKKLEVVDIPVGYTHSIINTGNENMVTIIWANESFDPENPDTYYMEV